MRIREVFRGVGPLPTRFLPWALCAGIVALATRTEARPAVHVAAGPPERAASEAPQERWGVLESLALGLADRTGGWDAGSIRRLGTIDHPLAASRLLDLARDQNLMAQPTLRLAWVRASAQQLQRQRPEHARLVQAMIDHGWGSEGLVVTLPASELGEHGLGLLAWARQTAAFALARDGATRGLLFLVSRASLLGRSADTSVRAEEAETAQDALCAFPPSVQQRRQMQALFSRPVIDRVVSCPPAVSDAHRKALAKGPAAFLTGSTEHRNQLLQALARLTRAGRLPAGFEAEGPWKWSAADAHDLAWKLRAFTVSFALDRSRHEAALPQQVRAAAQRAVAGSHEASRSAGTWLLAVTTPRSSIDLLASEVPSVKHTVQWQGWYGPIGDKLIETAGQAPGPHWLMPEFWTARSTATWVDSATSPDQRSSDHARASHSIPMGTLWAAPLARLVTSRPGPSPALRVEDLAVRLRSEPPELRAAFAHGLGFVSPAERPAARGLLSAAYQHEPEPSVRRAQCRALKRLGPTDGVKELAVLDRTPECRSLGAASVAPQLPRFFTSRISRRPIVWLATDEGSRVPVRPAADGFAATIGPWRLASTKNNGHGPKPMAAKKRTSTAASPAAQQTETEAATADEGPSFEESMDRLSKIVDELEEGELSLEESLQRFEEGVRLARASQSRLDEAEAKVEHLLAEDGAARRTREVEDE